MSYAIFVRLAATFLGIGYTPLAPGTAGTLAALIVLGPFRSNPAVFIPLLSFLGIIAVWASGAYARIVKRTDPKPAVIDEAFGMGLTLAALPRSGWQEVAAAFLLFRVFDILKPLPLKKLEKLPGGWGIVADDAGAAIYTILVLKAASALL